MSCPIPPALQDPYGLVALFVRGHRRHRDRSASRRRNCRLKHPESKPRRARSSLTSDPAGSISHSSRDNPSERSREIGIVQRAESPSNGAVEAPNQFNLILLHSLGVSSSRETYGLSETETDLREIVCRVFDKAIQRDAVNFELAVQLRHLENSAADELLHGVRREGSCIYERLTRSSHRNANPPRANPRWGEWTSPPSHRDANRAIRSN
jgi:hypothetical protein